MGFFKKIFRPVRKIAKKIIPKEVRPFLPYIAAGFGPATAGLTGTAFAKAAAQKALIAAAASAATDEQGDPLRAGLLAITPDVAARGLGAAGRGIGSLKPDSKIAQFLTDKGTSLEATLANPSFTDSAKIIGGQTAIDQTAKLAEIQQDEIDAYNKKLREQGITDAADRRKAIRDIYLNVGYTEDYLDSMLDRFGYKGGGGVMAAASMQGYGEFHRKYKKNKDKKRVKKAGGGMTEARSALFASLLDRYPEATIEEIREMMDKEFPETAEEKLSIADYADLAEESFKSSLGVESLFPQAPKPMGITPGFGNLPRMAEGGLMNLGGNEMDLRGGGFVPIGKKEKADDVPARLSKNEFVMTADAVRGAGGGDVNEGARRMYQTMDKLEAMA